MIFHSTSKPSLMLEKFFNNILFIEKIKKLYINYKPFAYCISFKVFFTVSGVIPNSKWNGSNVNPMSNEYNNNPSVVAAAQAWPV